MAMPLNAEPGQASEYASAGTDRALPRSPAISFSTTSSRTARLRDRFAAKAKIQDVRVSILVIMPC
jgi:hypothetical protein